MATITLTATALQSQRIQEAVTIFNAANGTTLTVKQWVYHTLREAVMGQLSEQAEIAKRAVEAAIAADMSGGT